MTATFPFSRVLPLVSLLLFAGPSHALEPTKELWLTAVAGGAGSPAGVDAFSEHCDGERNPNFRGAIENLTQGILAAAEQSEILKRYDEVYERQRGYMERSKPSCTESTRTNKFSGSGVLTAAMLGHPEFTPALDKRRQEIEKKVVSKMRSEVYKTRTASFNIRHKKKAGFHSIADADALNTVCEGTRDPAFRDGAAGVWDLNPRGNYPEAIAKNKQKFLGDYDAAYETRLAVYTSNSDLFCSEEAAKEIRMQAGFWTKGSGVAHLSSIIAEANAFTDTLDDESWHIYLQCMNRDILGATQNCQCIANTFMAARSSGDLRNEAAVWDDIKEQCPGHSWNVYDYQFSRCTNMNKQGRNFDCICSANAFVESFKKTPTSLMNYLGSMAGKSLEGCSSG